MVTITITGVQQRPTSELLQEVLRQAIKNPAAIITRLERTDRGADYFAPGEYDCHYKNTSANGAVSIPLKISISE